VALWRQLRISVIVAGDFSLNVAGIAA